MKTIIYLVFIFFPPLCFSQSTYYDYYYLAIKNIEKTDYKQAEYLLKKAIEKEPVDQKNKKTYGINFIDYYPNRELGKVYYFQFKYKLAIDFLQKSINNEYSQEAYDFLEKSKIKLRDNSTFNNSTKKRNYYTPKLKVIDIKINDTIISIGDCSIMTVTLGNSGNGDADSVKLFINADKSVVDVKHELVIPKILKIDGIIKREIKICINDSFNYGYATISCFLYDPVNKKRSNEKTVRLFIKD